jgi:hypothetical protein
MLLKIIAENMLHKTFPWVLHVTNDRNVSGHKDLLFGNIDLCRLLMSVLSLKELNNTFNF